MSNEIFVNQYCKDLTIIAGMPRSGKTLLAPLISSMKDAEIFHLDFLVEAFPALESVKMLSKEGLIYLLQYSIHNMSYNRAIGRNLNIRITDETSIWQSQNPEKYFERSFLNDRFDFTQDYTREYKFPLVLCLHNALTYVDILYKSFENIRVVNVCSHPVDIVDAWIKKDYGKDIYGRKGVSLPVFKWKNSVVPLYACGWEDKYMALSQTDRVISMLYQLYLSENNSLSKVNIKDKNKLLMVNYDELVLSIDSELKKISSFLEKPITAFTDKVINRSELESRKASILKREDKLSTIKKNASNGCINMIDEWIHSYSQIKF
jgi:hypothetical protein